MPAKQASKEEKATQATLQRSIVIGLGGSGGEVILRTRKLIAERFGSLDKMPLLRFMYLDTDPGWVKKMTLEVEEDVRLSPSEIVDMQVPDAGGLYEGIKAGNYPELSWFSIERLEGCGSITEGAGTIRQLGRLAFWQHFNSFRESLKKVVLDLVQQKHADEVASIYKVGVEPGLNVVVAAGLAGGTGSGCYLDVAYSAKEIVNSLAIAGPQHFTGYLIMPMAFQDVAGETGLANGYAALKELNYLSYIYSPNHLLASLYGKPRWEACYPNTAGGAILKEGEAPFEYCYLMDTNNGVVELTRADLFGMIAQSIANEYLLEFAHHKRALRANIINNVKQNDVLDCPARFLSYGQSSVHFPVHSIKRMLEHELASRAAAYWLRAAPDAEQLDPVTGDAGALSLEEVSNSSPVTSFAKSLILEQFLPSKNMRKDDLIASILSLKKTRLTDVPFQLLNEQKQQWIREKWRKEVFVGRAAATWDQWKRDFSDEGSDTSWGERIRVLVSNRVRTEQEILKHIEEQAWKLMNDPQRGPAYALAFVRTVKQPVEALRKRLLDEANSPQAIAQALGDVFLIQAAARADGPSLSAIILDRIGNEFNELERCTSSLIVLGGINRVRDQAEEYLRWCAQWCRARLEERARRLASDLCSNLLSHLDALEKNVRDKALFLGDLHAMLTKMRNEWHARAVSAEVVGEALTAKTVLDALKQTLKDKRKDMFSPRSVADAALKKLGKSLGDLSADSAEPIKNALLEAAREAIGDLSEHDLGTTEFAAYDLLVAQYPDANELRERLATTIAKCRPFVRLLSNPPGGNWSPTGTFPQGLVPKRCAGMRGGSAEADLERRKVLDALQACGWSPNDVQPMSDSSQIIFVQECGGFPLRALDGLQFMRTTYERRRRVPQNPPLHIVRDEMADVFPEPYAPSHEETTQAIARFVEGLALGLVREVEFPDPSGSERKLTKWAYMKRLDAINEMRPEPLAGSESAAIMRLALESDLREELDKAAAYAIREGGPTKCSELEEFVKARLESQRAELQSQGIEPSTNLRYQLEQDAGQRILETRCRSATPKS